ncbi:L,D-transpeptidase family protein [Sphingomonas piscis]|uniref:L,D-transpeptidase family protein n=1 Tax=Sphingomonas piscis TaxID=2714943 RepID=A0A6G7YQR1_9SPHN|nr:L,D-transpeptidase family protein [Sphingomonas piscis]QIK79080.1 L,D-transpeptidase family protein [Sphingomonas piscis]
MTKRMMTRAAIAAALLCGTPAFAANTSVLPGAAAIAFGAFEPGVQAFYQARGDKPLWLSQPGAIDAALSVLQRAPLDGFAAGPELANAVQSALQRASAGDLTARTEADRLLSSAWVRYVRILRTPPSGMRFEDASLLPAQRDARSMLTEAAAAASLSDYVRKTASVNPIYAQLRDAAWNEMQANGTGLDPQVAASLDHARFVPRSGRYVVVDAASARLLMIEDGQIRDSMKVIVGKSSSQTPMVASQIYYATVNPYWNVPTDLARKIIAPRVLQDGTAYLKSHRYEVLASYDENAEIIDPSTVDWKAVASGAAQVRVRQRPGADNSMGQIKFPFQNDLGIYLHDTPKKELFAQASRDLSNGCIRLEDAQRLGRWLLGRDPVQASAPEQHIALPQGVPVYVTYLTAQSENGRLAMLPDVYGRNRSASGAVVAAAY